LQGATGYLRILNRIVLLQKQHSDVEVLRPLLNGGQQLSLHEWIQPQRVADAVQHKPSHSTADEVKYSKV